MSLDLSDRYGTRRTGRRPLLIVVCSALAAIFLGWLAWAAWFHGNPEVTSEMPRWTVVSEHQADVVVTVRIHEAEGVNCKVRALSEDHVVVGEHNFTPVEGTNEVSVRTERRAATIDLVGCTSEEQNRPR
ncbi:DUF4307 domain-containing protein [Nocardioides sp. AE5]|uniref:DUF4307 domain-containing protein n=1 Tax=Nocardioides sp. AE5 TaxID=2962573 RepID=UPI0028826C38|nr:DUF4307 domain-containing protein [Nocardioides sp. AE5]MDT0202257.1 DUF4307 domain-containing protein [Nocardioides sp. AE5]